MNENNKTIKTTSNPLTLKSTITEKSISEIKPEGYTSDIIYGYLILFLLVIIVWIVVYPLTNKRKN